MPTVCAHVLLSMYTCSSACGAPSVNYSGVLVLGVRRGGGGGGGGGRGGVGLVRALPLLKVLMYI